jgi:hypothetical protein
VSALAAYHASWCITLAAGDRILAINVSEGTGATTFRYAVQLRGPPAGVVRHF